MNRKETKSVFAYTEYKKFWPIDLNPYQFYNLAVFRLIMYGLNERKKKPIDHSFCISTLRLILLQNNFG